MDILMKCGHTANSTIIDDAGNKLPACVICCCTEVDNNRPSLEGRKARCCDCGKLVDSDWKLPFFKYKGTWYKVFKKVNEDEFYCGCNGWD